MSYLNKAPSSFNYKLRSRIWNPFKMLYQTDYSSCKMKLKQNNWRIWKYRHRWTVWLLVWPNASLTIKGKSRVWAAPLNKKDLKSWWKSKSCYYYARVSRTRKLSISTSKLNCKILSLWCNKKRQRKISLKTCIESLNFS